MFRHAFASSRSTSALGQKRAIPWAEVVNDAVESGPKTGFRCACTREDFPVDEVVKNPGNAEPFKDDALGYALCAPLGSRSHWLSWPRCSARYRRTSHSFAAVDYSETVA